MTLKVPKGGNRNKKKAHPPDCRKQLFNDGKVGPINQIQVSTERIVRVRGILYDLDIDLYQAGPIIPKVPKNLKDFYRQIVRAWLSRHPILEKAEVRVTGGGLHIIPWLEEPIEITSDSDRERWTAIVQVVQAALPVDPQAPGITATTRALGSINTKHGTKVASLRERQPVTTDKVLDLYQKMCASPFRTVMHILTGRERLSPCPFCGKKESTLIALDHVGQCYDCSKVTLDQLYDLVLRRRKPAAKGGRSRVRKAK